jgi:protoporphyrinogen oxidase
MTPPDCSSLYGEFAYIQRSQTYIRNTLELALAKTKQLFNIADNDIVTKKVIPISHAYVLYDHWREKNLPRILHALEQQNIFSIGRYGAWKYCSMQETILDGKAAAQKVLIHE